MISICHADVVVELDESDGGRATSWKIAGHEILGRHSTHPINYGMYPMAPWAGRIRDNVMEWGGVQYVFPVNFEPWAIHGLVLDRPFEVIHHEQNYVVLEREFGDDWPVSGGVRCAWTLDDVGVTTEITCYSHADEFPAVLGWHPWFRREVGGIRAAWTTTCGEVLVRGDDSLPSGQRRTLHLGEGPFDDVFTGGTSASIEWPGLLRINIENSQPWCVVFDELTNFICIEPQTGPADGLSGRHAPATLVTPDHPLVMHTQWSITREQRTGSV